MIAPPPFHARAEVRAVLGQTLRPGGLALTGRLLDWAEAAGLAPGGRVLDLGCGPGASLQVLHRRGLKAVGVDATPPDIPGSLENVPRVQAAAEHLPFATASFHAVLCECAASCMGPGQALFDEIRRVLRPGGVLLLSDLYQRGPQCEARAGGGSCHEGALSLDGWRAALRRAGFCILTLEDHSRAMAELAARLVFAGALSLRSGQDCAPPGYFLCLATREG
ncbi:DVU_1556 family methyltransferase [Megalodesulfovibrio gigas]|uniref:Putative methyltransferase type 11 n=1 Tax=Megalodesulfovibrio gigas (strain ATCC 19364 / DSM 1382 / NCIMB 9332 / VKM B-1759) TaxID=1121448 RepID=T2GA56_MEGG1|nr:class I SAM-dependent methyltransferase [Megalodesulfovibrio gigas]AGW12797.1 putative methyltransferase type 11 [Megalodesulfovibrio gigas DSM 1382 = ATCC 19364]